MAEDHFQIRPLKIFRYVVQYNNGSAPNYDPPFVTLSTCKPGIRKSAGNGDLVLGFEGANIGNNPHGVVWAGIVAEKLLFEDYWNDPRFDGKKPDFSLNPDNIYTGKGALHGLVANNVHDHRNARTDQSGIFALVFHKAWRFACPYPTLPVEFNLRIALPNRRGHRVSCLGADEFMAINEWLSAQEKLPVGNGFSAISGTDHCSTKEQSRKNQSKSSKAKMRCND